MECIKDFPKEMIFDKESAERFYSIIKLHFKTLNMKVDEK